MEVLIYAKTKDKGVCVDYVDLASLIVHNKCVFGEGMLNPSDVATVLRSTTTRSAILGNPVAGDKCTMVCAVSRMLGVEVHSVIIAKHEAEFELHILDRELATKYGTPDSVINEPLQ